MLWPGLALTQTQPATGLAVHCTAETLPKYTAKKCTVFTSVGNYGFSERTELPKAACTSFLSLKKNALMYIHKRTTTTKEIPRHH